MGITFRYGDYIRFVRLGGRTIKDGEAAVIWNNQGVATRVIGPQRVIMWYSTIRFLDRFKAESHQYLVVRHRNGQVEHMQGPISLYCDPSVHDSISVKDGVRLETKDDSLVVFSSSTKNGGKMDEEKSERRFVYGPTEYIPAHGETIHNFRWKVPSSDLNKPETTKTTFPVLSMYQTRFWSTQLTLLTTESHHVPVTVAISYQIESLDKCLSAQDPIQLLELALTHDANRPLCKEEDTREFLSSQPAFPAFREAMAAVGFRLLKLQILNVKQSPELIAKLAQEQKQKREEVSKADIQVTEKLYSKKLEYLKGLKDLEVDLTKVLVAAASSRGTVIDAAGSKN